MGPKWLNHKETKKTWPLFHQERFLFLSIRFGFLKRNLCKMRLISLVTKYPWNLQSLRYSYFICQDILWLYTNHCISLMFTLYLFLSSCITDVWLTLQSYMTVVVVLYLNLHSNVSLNSFWSKCSIACVLSTFSQRHLSNFQFV